MAEQQSVARKRSQSKRHEQQEAEPGTGRNGHEEELARYEQELAGYLQERIKPGLNSGAIPLLARSIAKEIAHRPRPSSASEDAEVDDQPSAEADDQRGAETDDFAEADDEPSAEADDKPDADADDEPSAEADDEGSDESEEPRDFESDMHEFQAQLGEDWIVSFCVHGDDAWLTAERADGSQRLEAQTAPVLREAIEVLNEGGGRSS